MKILVTGSRDMPWGQYGLVKQALIDEHATEILEGGAHGADALASWVAHELSIRIREFKPDWGKDGAAAGPLRNQRMIDEKPDLVIAFYAETGITPGTRDTVNRAISHGIRVRHITYPAPEEKKS